MVHPNIRWIRAFGMAVGSVVGAGVFGLPYAFAQSGYAVGFVVLFVMGVLLTLLQLMFAEVAIQSDGKDRLVGYVRRYLGAGWARVTLIAFLGTFWGAMIAYMIVGGTFWRLLLGPIFDGPAIVYSLLIAAIASALIYRGLRFASRLETFIVGILLFLFVFMILAALPHVRLSHLATVDWSQVLLPYGVVLFALSGLGVVPEMKDVLGKKLRNRLPHVVVSAMTVIALLYAVFSFVVIGVNGLGTTQVAFEGLTSVLGSGFRVIGALLGSATILSIYLMVGIELMKTLEIDFRLPRPWAWLATCGVPVLLFLAGLREFVGVIGFVGAVFSGFVGIVVVRMYEAFKESPVCRGHYCLRLPRSVSWLIMTVFAGGILMELWSLMG